MPLQETKNGVVIKVKVQPKAQQDEILSIKGDRLRLRVKAPPQKGKANQACINLLAKVLSLNKREIKLISGVKAREKIFFIQNMRLDDLKERLGIP
ncbi:MAG: YggU family protein [Thermodesulfobacteriota bacterium]|nr:MAG: YggU family protein [Thermodesulfobacteriota bacterium]